MGQLKTMGTQTWYLFGQLSRLMTRPFFCPFWLAKDVSTCLPIYHYATVVLHKKTVNFLDFSNYFSSFAINQIETLQKQILFLFFENLSLFSFPDTFFHNRRRHKKTKNHLSQNGSIQFLKHIKTCVCNTMELQKNKGVFRTLSNIIDGAFLQKHLMAEKRQQFFQNDLSQMFYGFLNTLMFFKSNWGQASALKVANIFKVFGAQSCLIVAQWFE